jgi:hypothetical protein
MPSQVEYTDAFEAWWSGLDVEEQVSVAAVVEVLAEMGPSLSFPYSSDVKSSRQPYAFDPRRVAILLLGGAKTGGARWYERMVPGADRLYGRHLEALKREDDPHA